MSEATSIATIFEDLGLDHAPDGWPPVKQMHLTEAAAELRRLEAQLQKETAARQAAQIEAEALKERLVRADAEKCAAVLAERIAPKAPVQEPEIDVRNIMLAVVPGFDGMGAEVYAKSTKDVEDKLSALGSELEEWQLGIRRLPAPVQEPCAELIDYILQADIHNRLTPRVVDIAYSAWSLGRSGKNMDDGGPCDWFNGTKPMVMTQLAKIKKDLAEEAQPRKAVKLSDSEILTALDVEYVSSAQNRHLFLSDARIIEAAVWAKLGVTE
mgnify:CR=1 FL=1